MHKLIKNLSLLLIDPEFTIAPLLLQKTFTVFIFKILGMASSYIFAFFVSKYFGAEGWGLFSMALGIITLGMIPSKYGFDTALLKYAASMSNEKNKLHSIYKTGITWAVILSIIISIIIIIFSVKLSKIFYHTDSYYILIILTSLTILPNVLLLINSEGLRGLGFTNKYMVIQNNGIYTIGTLILLAFHYNHNGDGNIPIFISYLCAVIFTYLLSQYWWNKVAPIKIISTIKTSIKNVLDTCLPLMWSNAMFACIMWTDTLMIGAFSSEKEAGIYNIAIKIGSLVSLPLFAITSFAAPKFATLFGSNKKSELRQLVQQSTNVIFLLTIPIFIATFAFPQFFLNLFGDEFINGSVVLMIIVTGQFVKSVCGSTDYLLQMTNHGKTFQYIIMVAMAFNLLLNFILIPRMGAIGAATTNALTALLWNVLAVIFIYKKLQINAIANPFKLSQIFSILKR